jgi:uncharacterized membrane protein
MLSKLNLHPKVAWTAIISAVLTVLATIVSAIAAGDKQAITSAVVGGIVTIFGLVTGYTVPTGNWSNNPVGMVGSVIEDVGKTLGGPTQ